MYKKNVKNLCVCFGPWAYLCPLTPVPADLFWSACPMATPSRTPLQGAGTTEQENVCICSRCDRKKEMKGAVCPEKYFNSSKQAETEDCSLTYKDYYGWDIILNSKDGIALLFRRECQSKENRRLKKMLLTVEWYLSAVDKSSSGTCDVE